MSIPTNLLVAATLFGLGYFAIQRVVPKVPDIQEVRTAGNLEMKTVEKIGTLNPPYSTCQTDLNCKGSSFIGAQYRCEGGECVPFARSEVGILYNPKEIDAKKICGRYYLLGEGSKCDKDSQCSVSGKFEDLTEGGTFSGITSETYCNNSGRCDKKGKDWLGIYWKADDVPDPSKLRYRASKVNDNRATINRIIEKQESCKGDLTAITNLNDLRVR